MQHFTNIELISTNNQEYIANNKRYKRKSDNIRKFKKVDHFASDYNKALRKWEWVVQSLLARISNQFTNRILKFSTTDAVGNYREIDFIAQSKSNELIFCELKLKENFKEEMGDKTSGWAQLNKSLNIASSKYQGVSGIAICVDMSHVYGTASCGGQDDYIKYSELSSLLSTPPSEHKTVWLNSLEITQYAIQYGLLTSRDIKEMKKLHLEMKDPLSTLTPSNNNTINNPFQMLAGLKSKQCMSAIPA